MRLLETCGRVRSFAALAVFLLGMICAPAAEDLVWTDNPWGRVTFFGSGPLGTRLSTEASGQIVETKSLFYLDTMSLPAEIESFAESGTANMTARARLGIEASNDSGLLLGGNVALLPEGSGTSGFASIHVFALVELLDPAVIQIRELMSAVSEGDGSDFSVALFRSDETGNAIGSELLAFSGSSSAGWDGSYASDAPGFFLLQVSAATIGAGPGVADFAFRLDIADHTAVPEPSAGILVLAGGLAAWIVHRRIRLR